MSRTTTTARRRIGAKGVSVDVAEQTRQRAPTDPFFFLSFALANVNACVTCICAARVCWARSSCKGRYYDTAKV
jgi:hypothetical protein